MAQIVDAFHNGKPIAATIVSRIGNAASASGRLAKATIKGKRVIVPQEEQQRRLNICEACEFYINKKCKKCGCFTNLKTRLATEHCPLTHPKW